MTAAPAASLDAAGLLRSVGLLADGPVVLGRPVPARGPGVYVVELPAPRAAAPIELTRVGKWLERVPSLRLDGARPSSRALAARLGAFWVPSATVLFVGSTEGSIGGRITALERHVLGDRRPHPSGHWLKALDVAGLRVWWAGTDATDEYEDALLAAFGQGVPEAERSTVHDPELVLPFANLRTPSGDRKAHGISGSLVAEEARVPEPPVRVVEVPPGDADGAGGERKGTGTTRRAPTSTAAPARPAARAAARTSAPRRPAREAVQLSAEGLERLRTELDELTRGRRPEVVARIRAAKELGDLKENADYTAAREEQSFLEGRIQALEARLRAAVVVEAPADSQTVVLGSKVTVEHDGETLTWTLVGTTESDPAAGRISSASPVGRALLGRAADDTVTVRTPRGDAAYRIVAIE